jgi:hypothetical protein
VNQAALSLEEPIYEQNHEALVSLSGPDLHRKEVGCDDLLKMLSENMNWRAARLPTSSSATPSKPAPERVRKTTWKE